MAGIMENSKGGLIEEESARLMHQEEFVGQRWLLGAYPEATEVKPRYLGP